MDKRILSYLIEMLLPNTVELAEYAIVMESEISDL